MTGQSPEQDCLCPEVAHSRMLGVYWIGEHVLSQSLQFRRRAGHRCQAHRVDCLLGATRPTPTVGEGRGGPRSRSMMRARMWGRRPRSHFAQHIECQHVGRQERALFRAPCLAGATCPPEDTRCACGQETAQGAQQMQQMKRAARGHLAQTRSSRRSAPRLV